MKHVVVLLEDKEAKVGSVIAQYRFKDAVEQLGCGSVQVVVTDVPSCMYIIPCLNNISYLMLNEPSIDLQDKWEHNQKNYWERVSAIKSANPGIRVGLQLHGEHLITSSYLGKYDNYFKYAADYVDDVYTITEELCTRTYSTLKFESYNLPRIKYMPSCGLVDFSSVILSDKDNESPICWAGRVAPTKKPVIFLRLMNLIYPEGGTPFKIYGDTVPGIHNVGLNTEWDLTKFDRESIEVGSYQLTQIGSRFISPSSGHYASWNGVQSGRGSYMEFSPRLELSTIESWQGGCIPILFNETVPDWVPKHSYIGINYLDVNHISRADGLRNAADHIKCSVEKLMTVDKSMIEFWCQEALESVRVNTRVEQTIINFIGGL